MMIVRQGCARRRKKKDAAIDGVFGVLLWPGAACMRREGNWVCLILAGGLGGHTRTHARYAMLYVYPYSPLRFEEMGLRILFGEFVFAPGLGRWGFGVGGVYLV